MYKRMTTKEKINYLYVRNKGVFIGGLVLIIISIILTLIYKDADSQSVLLLMSTIIVLLLIIVILISLFYPVIIFSKNVQITDGYIDEKGEYPSNGTRRDFWGIARTFDGSKKTKKKKILRYYAYGKVPVKIIVYNNVARDFFFTKESDDYVASNNQKLNKKQIIGFSAMILIALIIATIILNIFIK